MFCQRHHVTSACCHDNGSGRTRSIQRFISLTPQIYCSMCTAGTSKVMDSMDCFIYQDIGCAFGVCRSWKLLYSPLEVNSHTKRSHFQSLHVICVVYNLSCNIFPADAVYVGADDLVGKGVKPTQRGYRVRLGFDSQQKPLVD